jgi:hypothetical protein
MDPIVRNLWEGKPFPFPVLLDNSFETAERLSVESFNVKLLIDPAGHLVEEDEKNLAEKLRAIDPK